MNLLDMKNTMSKMKNTPGWDQQQIRHVRRKDW